MPSAPLAPSTPPEPHNSPRSVRAHFDKSTLYNLLGQNMATLVDGLRPAGEHEVQLDASGWPGGMYVYVLETGTHRLTRHMVLLK